MAGGIISLPDKTQSMIFSLNEEQLAVKEAAREFAQNELKPGVIERDRDMVFPKEEVRKMGETWIPWNDGFARIWR
jgi:alkylation response protein AidB-like acyl-CoA dehydrogenase